MANSDKNILITPATNTSGDPRIVYTPNTAANAITQRLTDSGVISFEGSAGQLFSITNSLSGTLFSVNDVSGIPSIDVADTGLVRIAPYNGNLVVGSTAAIQISSVDSEVSITGSAANQVPLAIRGAASQSAVLQSWQSSAGTELLNVSSAGQVNALNGVNTNAIRGLDTLSAITVSNGRGITIGTSSAIQGGGTGVIGIANAGTVPSSSPTGGGILFVEAGALKYRGTSGSSATLATADSRTARLTYSIPDTAGTASYVLLGTWTTAQNGKGLYIQVVAKSGYNATTSQNQVTELYFKTSNGTSNNGGFYGDGSAFRNTALGTNSSSPSLFRIVQVSTTSYAVYGNFSTFTGDGGSFYSVDFSSGSSWANSSTIVATPTGTFLDITPSTLIGPQGAQGTTGATGLQGTTGTTGIQGLTGTQGLQGTTGVNGSVGPEGIQGPTGATGAQGIQGTTGLQGISGATSNSFATVSTPSGTSPVADSVTDTLTYTATNGITITGNSGTDSIEFSTNATSANSSSTIIARDVSGSFTANVITAVTGFSGIGAGLTGLNASNISSGTIPGDRGVPAGSTTPSFVEYNGITSTVGQFDGGTTAPTDTTRLNYNGNLYATNFFGNGANLTSLSGSNISSGTVADARIASTIARNNVAQTFTGRQTFSDGINISGSATTIQLGGNAGTAGNVLTSQGGATLPTWSELPYRIAANRTTTAGGTALTINTQETATTVTFPASRFSGTPSVTANTSSARYGVAVTSVSSTGFTMIVRNVSDATGTTYTWHYQAIEIVAGMGS